MRQTLTEKLLICLAGLLITVTCSACENRIPEYSADEYLQELSSRSGIGEPDDYLKGLKEWEVIKDENDVPENGLTYDYVARTIGNFMGESLKLQALKDRGIVDQDVDEKDPVRKEDAEKIIEKAVVYRNDQSFDPSFDYELVSELKDPDEDLETGDLVFDGEDFLIVTASDGENHEFRKAEFEEVFSEIDIADTFEVDFETAEVIPYGEEFVPTAYVNEKYELLASNNHVFNSEGFRISYTLNGSGIDVHISKNENGMNIYGDLSINSVKPSLKWSYKEGDLKNCFFNVKMNTTEKIGCSTGKYGDYHVTFRNLDSSSFSSLLRSMVEPEKDKVEASIPICRIKTPIPQIPTAFLNFDILIRLYVSGKAEIVLYNTHSLGFETRNGQIRFINDNTHDFDSIIQASAKAALGLNVAIEAATFRLADVELDGGIRASVKSTMHLYSENGDKKAVASEVAYSALEEIAKENPDVKICGDLSLNWLMDLTINTSDTKAGKYGFGRSFTILDEEDQIFGNLHHLENGHFVEKCTRTGRNEIRPTQGVHSDRIVLDSYAEVIKAAENYQIIIRALPQGYSESDLVYTSENNEIATVAGGTISGISPGSVRIKVCTSDGKYEAYVNILVSTG